MCVRGIIIAAAAEARLWHASVCVCLCARVNVCVTQCGGVSRQQMGRAIALQRRGFCYPHEWRERANQKQNAP